MTEPVVAGLRSRRCHDGGRAWYSGSFEAGGRLPGCALTIGYERRRTSANAYQPPWQCGSQWARLSSVFEGVDLGT